MLKPEQLSVLRQLPGAASVTEENADAFLFDALQATNTTVSELTTAKNDLTNQVNDLHSKVVSPIDPKLAEGHINLFCKNMDFAVTSGKLLPEQNTLIQNFLKPAGKANVSAVSPSGQVLLDADTISKVLEINKPAGLVKEVSQAQPVVRQEPGKEGEEKPVTSARQNELLGLIGQQPVPTA